MGILDKIKNALFEEEIVEVEEKPKKPKTKTDFFKEKKQDKPIAKKVVLPEKKETKVEELDENDYVDEDFEISPAQREELEERIKEEFDVSDEDLKVEEDVFDEVPPEPEIVKVLDYEKEEVLPEIKEEPKYYQSKPVEKYPYGMSSNKSTYSEYSGGAYEKKEARTHFTPSPIISPIYGILDKNYKKEDVVQKKEVRLTSSYSRSNLNLDDVRKKAYGTTIKEDLEREFMDESVKEDTSYKVEKDEDVNLLVDLSEDEKPSVKELTMGDALEYFQDLGLEYNVDYVDASNTVGRRVKDNYDEEETTESISRLSRLDEERVEEKTTEAVEEKKEEVDSDNLFDLIDSMYKDNE